jgi:ABC-type multidrug transport system fused ATPase/permease subunit
MTNTVTVLGVFGVAAIRLIPSINQIIGGLMQLSNSRNAVNLLFSDLKSLKTEGHSNRRSRDISQIVLNSIDLKKVSYTYPGTNHKVLNNISMSINSGESIGIIGKSGSGKTTLINLLLGFLDADNGELLVNNELINTNIDAWRDLVAYLPQQIFLTDDSIKANIALGVEKHKIDNKKVIQALEKSKLSTFVQSLPDGVDTILGERGKRLSGGQRQRIALARSFYHNRDVLIMDESTSALDNETEAEVVEEIRRLKGSKTVIVIAHRLTTLRYCDRIYRLEKGRIVEHGSYKAIIDKT